MAQNPRNKNIDKMTCMKSIFFHKGIKFACSHLKLACLIYNSRQTNMDAQVKIIFITLINPIKHSTRSHYFYFCDSENDQIKIYKFSSEKYSTFQCINYIELYYNFTTVIVLSPKKCNV